MRRFWKLWMVRREVNRPIPGEYNWYMIARERMMWHCLGWRVKYWVCPLCGERRSKDVAVTRTGDGWKIPIVHECGEALP